MAADIISSAYRSRASSGDFVEWSTKYPNAADSLNMAMRESMGKNG
jgi:hypothetical protein